MPREWTWKSTEMVLNVPEETNWSILTELSKNFPPNSSLRHKISSNNVFIKYFKHKNSFEFLLHNDITSHSYNTPSLPIHSLVTHLFPCNISLQKKQKFISIFVKHKKNFFCFVCNPFENKFLSLLTFKFTYKNKQAKQKKTAQKHLFYILI